ncbi:MAG TPA: thioredoxin domain-containing protein [Thermoanaerobaculia bacterium]|jgi:protein-disulfide isomerase
MPRLVLTVVAAAFGLSCVAAPGAFADDAETKQRIIENLKVTYEQLRDAGIEVTSMGPSALGDGAQEGTLVIGGRQEQRFLLTADTKSLYLLGAGPIDVSRNSEEIQAELKRLEEEKMAKAAETRKTLEEAIANLPYRGSADAPVTIVEFSDFQCPYCSRGAETMEQILAKYPNDVKFVFQHFPLDFHPWAKPAAIAATCAANQKPDAFWTLHDKYFEEQKAITPANVLEKSKEYLAGSGVDMAKWSECAENKESEAYKTAAATVDKEMATGQKLGVSGTPGFFVNGQFLSGAQPLASFEPLIQAAKQ